MQQISTSMDDMPDWKPEASAIISRTKQSAEVNLDARFRGVCLARFSKVVVVRLSCFRCEARVDISANAPRRAHIFSSLAKYRTNPREESVFSISIVVARPLLQSGFIPRAVSRVVRRCSSCRTVDPFPPAGRRWAVGMQQAARQFTLLTHSLHAGAEAMGSTEQFLLSNSAKEPVWRVMLWYDNLCDSSQAASQLGKHATTLAAGETNARGKRRAPQLPHLHRLGGGERLDGRSESARQAQQRRAPDVARHVALAEALHAGQIQ